MFSRNFSRAALLAIGLILSEVTVQVHSATLAGLLPRASSGCATTGAVSCHNTTVQEDLCCFEAQGLLLQTQFWDTSGPGTALPTTWTVHGLWPDNCDGSFQENCDPSRDYDNITQILQGQGQTDLLEFMQTFWLNINGENEELWEHEWATHGTCYSTLEPDCFPKGTVPGTDAVDFFLTVQRIYQSLPTFQWLEQGGITPSSDETFTLSEIIDVLQEASGVIPSLDCDGSALNQISWYFNLQGSVIDGNFIMIDAPEKGSCASSGLTYPPKPGNSGSGSGGSGGSSGGSGGGSSSGGSGSAPSSVPAKSTLSIITSNGSSKGGVLTSGTWSVQTPATFTATTSGSGFTLSTSKGQCGVSSSGQFECGSGVSSSVFGAQSSGGNLLLTFQGSSDFSASSVPSGSAQISIFTGSGEAQDFNIVFNAK